MDELIATLGSLLDAPATTRTLARYRLMPYTLAPLEEGTPALAYLRSMEDGLLLQLDAHGIVQEVFLYAGVKEGMRRYAGSLGPGLSFDSTRADIESALGAPTRSALPGKTLLGPHGGWLRYDFPTHSVHYAFGVSGGLELVTIGVSRVRSV